MKTNNPSLKGGLGTARLPGDERSEEHVKKSEAASKLAKKIQSTWPELDQVSPHHCHHIITWLEQIGMSPPDVLRPATKYEIQQGYSFVDQYSQEDVVWDQVWEPEDITCSRCGTVNDTRIKMGGLVCNNCNMVVVYPGTEEYNQRLEAERRSESFLITDTATMEDPLIEVASPETSVEVTTSEAPAEERDNETLVEVTRMWRPN